MKRYKLQLFHRTCFRVLGPGLITACGVGLTAAQGPVLVDPGSKEEAPVIEESPTPAVDEAPTTEAPATVEESPTPATAPAPEESEDTAANQVTAAEAKQEMLRKLEAAKRVSRRAAATAEVDERDDPDAGLRPATRDEFTADDPLPQDDIPADEALTADAEELPAPRTGRTARDLSTQRRLRMPRDAARDSSDRARDAELDRPATRDGMRSVVVRGSEPPVDRGERAWEALGIVLDGRFEDSIVVRRVEPGTPAQQIGLRAGDTIVSINGREVATPDDVLDVLQEMRSVRDLDLGVARRSSRTLRLSDRTASSRVRVDPEVDQTAYESYFRGLPPAGSQAGYADAEYAAEYPEADPNLQRRPSYGELYREERYRAEPPPERRRILRGGLFNRFRGR